MSTATMDPEPATAIEVGWHYGLSMEEYLDIGRPVPDPDTGDLIECEPVISGSLLVLLRQVRLRKRSLAHVRHEMINQIESTAAQKLGSATHSLTLEEHDFLERYACLGQCQVITGKGTRCTSQASQLHVDGDHLCGTHIRSLEPDLLDTEKEILTESEYTNVIGMRRRVRSYPEARELLEEEGPVEAVGIWRDSTTGLLCKIRPDKLAPKLGTNCNFKTARDGSEWAFSKVIDDLGYHLKGAFQRMVLQALDFDHRHHAFVVVESSEPWEPVVYRLHDNDLDAGEREIGALLGMFVECVESGDWPGYGRGIVNITRPDYAWTRDMREGDLT